MPDMADITPEISASKPHLAAEGLAIAAGILAAGVAIKFAPRAVGPMFRAGEELLAGESTAAGETALNSAVAAVKGRVNLPSFASVKAAGQVAGETAGQSAHSAADIPGIVNVASDSWLARTYEAVKPSVLQMQTEQGRAMGSGFIVDAEKNLLATSHHVVEGLEHQTHSVQLGTGQRFQARVIGFDRDADVAVLKIDGAGGHKFQALDLGTPLELESKRAAAIGFPQTGDKLPVISPGSFTHAMYTEQSRLYFDMKTFFGNSGGPIVSREGRVLGLVKTGTPADEYTAAGTIGANVEHLRSVLGLVRNREIAQGPLSVESEILGRGRAMLSASDILGLNQAPETAVKIKSNLAVRVLG